MEGFPRDWGGARPCYTSPPAPSSDTPSAPQAPVPLRIFTRASQIDKSARCLRHRRLRPLRSRLRLSGLRSLPRSLPHSGGAATIPTKPATSPAAPCRPPPPTAKTRAALLAPGSPSTATTRRAAAFSPPTTSGEGARREGGCARAGLETCAPVPWTAHRPVGRAQAGPRRRAPEACPAPSRRSHGPSRRPSPTAASRSEGPACDVGRGWEAGGGWASRLSFWRTNPLAPGVSPVSRFGLHAFSAFFRVWQIDSKITWGRGQNQQA